MHQIMAIRIHVGGDVIYPEMVKYTLRTIFFNKQSQCSFVQEQDSAVLTVGVGAENDVRVSPRFLGHLTPVNAQGHVVLEDGTTDFITTIFYYINSLQEYNSRDLDDYGRFKFANSLQCKLNFIDKNFVQQLIENFIGHQPKLSSLAWTKRRSKFFLTHDIDSVYGATKEDGNYAVRHMKFGQVFRLMFNAAFSRPDWLNMDEIMKLESEYDFKSTFYWLLIKDRLNSDYKFSSSKIQRQFKGVADKGWENGLHKSMGGYGFRDEMRMFGSKPAGNRFHYLRFALPEGYDTIEATGIPLDTSLGFSEAMGFRNSYGLPFMPYSLRGKRPYNFVEVPQLIMDRTFFKDRKSVSEIKKTLIDFFEANKYNCVFTINWHNNFFTELKYKGYADIYRALLEYFKDNGIECITQSGIIEEYYKPEMYLLKRDQEVEAKK
ncbi:MAG: hypothetical protein JWO06_2636 [Bacteroidota bacterium]|nr:hypothetical protein [Bacteroidota bacterium]